MFWRVLAGNGGLHAIARQNMPIAAIVRPCPPKHTNNRRFHVLVMATFIIFSIVPCCWPFLSTFLPPLPFLDLSSHNPAILAVIFLVFCKLLVSLSQIFSVVSSISFHPAHFISLLPILPTMQTLVPNSHTLRHAHGYMLPASAHSHTIFRASFFCGCTMRL